MKRAGFTMIELIFVIVILGILAAVAIPKLAATRTDASVSKGATELATIVGELGSFYTAQGTFVGKTAAEVSNVSVNVSATPIADSVVWTYTDDNNNSCVTITFNNAADGNITLAAGGNNAAVCTGIRAAATDLIRNHSFGGSNVNWN